MLFSRKSAIEKRKVASITINTSKHFSRRSSSAKLCKFSQFPVSASRFGDAWRFQIKKKKKGNTRFLMEPLRWIIFFPPANLLASRHVWVIRHAHASTVTEYRARTVFISRGEKENGRREEMTRRPEVARVYNFVWFLIRWLLLYGVYFSFFFFWRKIWKNSCNSVNLYLIFIN